MEAGRLHLPRHTQISLYFTIYLPFKPTYLFLINYIYTFKVRSYIHEVVQRPTFRN